MGDRDTVRRPHLRAGNARRTQRWKVANGKFTSAIELPETKEAVAAVAKLAKSGVFHPDSFSTTINVADLFGDGTTPVMYNNYTTWGPYMRTYAATSPTIDIGGIIPPSYDGATKPVLWEGAPSYSLTAVKKGSRSRVKELLRIANWLAAPFGTKEYLLRKYGVAGVDYTLKGADPILNQTGQVEVANFTATYIADSPQVIYEPEAPEVAKAEYAYQQKAIPITIPATTLGLFSDTDASKGAQLTTAISNTQHDIWQGHKPISAWTTRSVNGARTAETRSVRNTKSPTHRHIDVERSTVMPASRISRRTFLRRTAVASAALAVPVGVGVRPAVAAVRPDMPAILNNGTYPIGVFVPPPLAETTDARYAQLADCGITFVEGGTGGNDVYNLEPNKVLLPVCERHNVLALVNDERIGHFFEEPSDQWSTLMQQALEDYLPYPAFAGFHGGDELPAADYPGVAGVFSLLRQMAPSKLNQVNLYGNPYAGPTYQQYLQTYISQTDPSFLSFDRYMLLDSAQDTPAQQQSVEADYLAGWAFVRNAALGAGRLPTWMYIQAVEHSVGANHYRAPSLADLLWQMNTSLAYGCTGVQYFTYWTPAPYGAAMIDKSGNPTATWEYAREANTQYLQPLGRQLLGLTSETVAHFGETSLPAGVVGFTGNRWVASASGSPMIISTFSHAGHQAEGYVFVANRSYADSAVTTLTLSGVVDAVEAFDLSTRKYRPVRTPSRSITARLDAGAGALYRLRVRP